MYGPDQPVTVYTKPKKTPFWVVVFVSFSCVLLVTVLFRYSWQRVQANEAAKAALLSAAEKKAWEQARRDHEEHQRAEEEAAQFRARKDLAFTWCRNQKDVPVMGFGFKVICLKSEAVSWEQKIDGDMPLGDEPPSQP